MESCQKFSPEARGKSKFLLKYYLEFVLVILITLMVSAVFVQVVFRYVFRSPPFWTEEFARYIFIWVTFVGAAYTFKEKEHIVLTLVYQYIPPRVLVYYKHLINLIILIMLVILIYYGIKSCINIYGILSPALSINLAYINAALPVGGIIMLLCHLNSILKGGN